MAAAGAAKEAEVVALAFANDSSGSAMDELYSLKIHVASFFQNGLI